MDHLTVSARTVKSNKCNKRENDWKQQATENEKRFNGAAIFLRTTVNETS